MIFHRTNLADCFVIEPVLLEDERGFFARTFDAEEFETRGLNSCCAQTSVSFNRVAGTLRGLHFQLAPYAETKLVQCTRGRVFDVAVDLRPESETYLAWHGLEISAENHLVIYIPEGMAHGFVTLTDESVLTYDISPAYVSEAACGIRWDDPVLSICWPRAPALISSRDVGWPPFVPTLHV